MRLTHPSRRRSGTILIVVLALLALFAVVGLSFVLYSGSEATASRTYREAQDIGTTPPNPDGEQPAITVLTDILYDQFDDTSAMYSSLRGHGISRGMYGWSYRGTFANPAADATTNTSAYAGVGPVENVNYMNTGVPRSRFVNYAWFPGSPFGFPERLGFRAAGPPPNFGPQAQADNAGAYFGKHANYTYPDVNNLFLGLANPVNGQVLVPSFFRPWVFAQNPNDPNSVANALNPAANTNWTNAQGKFLTLRPRPQENPGFPYPPANPDGTFTGDVQNLVGAVYPHAAIPNAFIPKNDSIWIDAGYPVQYWNGKKYKPLFAILVLPLDNRVNLSAGGNLRGLTAANAPTHDSNQGFGPWEVNPLRLLADPRAAYEYQRILHDRHGAAQDKVSISPTNLPPLVGTPALVPLNPPGTAASYTARAFGSATPPDYAQIDWDGAAPAGAASRFLLPGQTGLALHSPFATTPRWNENVAAARYGNSDPSQAGGGESFRHPSLFNPYFVPTADIGNGHVYPASDMAMLGAKFGDDTGVSTNAKLGILAPYSLGTWSTSTMNGGIPYPPGRSPANQNRMNVTTISNSLAVPGLMPGHSQYTGYQYAAGTPFPIRSAAAITPIFPGQAGADVPTVPGGSPQQLRAAMSYLQGAVDLNRPLAEFRLAAGTALPLAPNNVIDPGTDLAGYVKACTDRQLLARDIFNRLVIATGASAALNPATGYMTPTTAPGTPEYDALRYLAQLAVNVVDYIDADDISTMFVWNPNDPTQNPADPTTTDYALNLRELGNRIVFGVEKPKLVANEIYAEAVADPTDGNQAQKPFQARLWVELLNPAAGEIVAGNTLGANAKPAVNQTTQLYDPAFAAVRPYQIVLVQNGQVLDAELLDRSNVTGKYSAATNVAIRYNFSTSASALNLAPNAGTYGDVTAATGVPGIAVVGPDASGANPMYEFNPRTLNAAAPVGLVPAPPAPPADPLNQMFFLLRNSQGQIGPDKEANIPGMLQTFNAQKPTVMLRRLMNPYLPANDPTDPTNNPTGAYDGTRPANPYLTVDVFQTGQGQDLLNDAVRVGADSARKGAVRPAMTPQPMTRHALGRMQPYAGSPLLVAVQQPVPAETNFPQTTFFRHNGQTSAATGPAATWDPTINPKETLWFPFEWMVHLDRPVVNPLEATFAAAVPSHLLTQRFLGIAGLKHGHLAPWTPDLAAPAAALLKTSATQIVDEAGLSRALELFAVKPWTLGTPHAGKVAGKININLITDPRVLMALADPQAANAFTATDVVDPANWANPATVFGRLTEARRGLTPVAQAYKSQYDPVTGTNVTVQVPGPFDTPIRSFGSAAPGAYDAASFPFTALPGAQGVNSTTARTVNVGGADVGVFSLPNQPHPYLQQELLRKVQNNLTTTSNTFAVYITVGFFEVTNSPNNQTGAGAIRPQLGKEMFKDMPGDLRQKYFAVIDRSNLSLDPTNLRLQGGKPFYTETLNSLTASAADDVVSLRAHGGVANGTVQIAYEGQNFNIVPSAGHNPAAGNFGYLRLGTGDATEWVAVNSVKTFDANTGIAILSVARNSAPSAVPSRLTTHAAGDPVTNVIPGNPGPQPAFNPRSPNYQSVVPYFGKIE